MGGVLFDPHLDKHLSEVGNCQDYLSRDSHPECEEGRYHRCGVRGHQVSKEVNRNIADQLIKESNSEADKKAKRKKVARSKAKAGRIQADKRSKK
jgi:hypothetical protein